MLNGYYIFGVVIVFMVIVYFVVRIAERNFTAFAAERFQNIMAMHSNIVPEIIKDADIEGLPPVVQKWLKNSGVVGKERIKSCRSRQNILLRFNKDAKWMPAKAVQYITTEEPGFVWKVKVKFMPLLFFSGLDQYFKGKGSMIIKLLALIKVAQSAGEKADQGSLLRYLGESVWYPSAALESYIKWEAVDSNSAIATMSYEGITASGLFSFNDQGEVSSFSARRYMENKGKYTLEQWAITVREYGEFSGFRIPVKCDAVWKLDTGDFHWYQLEIEDTKYNILYNDPHL